jgi:hypothetical protein
MPKQKSEIISVQGMAISVITQDKDDYISLTDMAKMKNAEIPATVISHWMTTNFTMNFMGVWERMHNPNFNLTGFREVKMMSGGRAMSILTSRATFAMKLVLNN